MIETVKSQRVWTISWEAQECDLWRLQNKFQNNKIAITITLGKLVSDAEEYIFGKLFVRKSSMSGYPFFRILFGPRIVIYIVSLLSVGEKKNWT